VWIKTKLSQYITKLKTGWKGDIPQGGKAVKGGARQKRFAAPARIFGAAALASP
jgi:transcription termination factor Rho